MANRQQKRHPTHPSLPIQYPSKKSAIQKKEEKKVTSASKAKPRKSKKIF